METRYFAHRFVAIHVIDRMLRPVSRYTDRAYDLWLIHGPGLKKRSLIHGLGIKGRSFIDPWSGSQRKDHLIHGPSLKERSFIDLSFRPGPLINHTNCKEQFLLFPQCFLSIWGTFHHFHQT